MRSNHPELAEVRRGSIAGKPPRTRAQPPDTPCSPGGGAVGELRFSKAKPPRTHA